MEAMQRKTYQLAFDMPRPTLISGLLRRKMDIGKFNNNLKTAFTKHFFQIEHWFSRKTRFEFPRFRENKHPNFLLPCIQSIVIGVFTLTLLPLRLLFFWYGIWIRVVFARGVFDPRWGGKPLLKGRERHVPKWNNFCDYLLDNAVDLFVALRV